MSLNALARLLGIKPDHAEDALHSERAARAVLTRRSLFAAGGALAAGSVFSFAASAESAGPVFIDLETSPLMVADVKGCARYFYWIRQGDGTWKQFSPTISDPGMRRFMEDTMHLTPYPASAAELRDKLRQSGIVV